MKGGSIARVVRSSRAGVRRCLAAGIVALALTATAAPAGGQQYFGKNQVQYDHFDWQVIETPHFLIHYYPEEEVAAHDAARMAERAYARLSRILGHEFREKKPIMLFQSRADFGQNNVLGDLGEGTGGVTEALRHRILMPFTGDYSSFERVLTHELVHEFQYDVFARGKAGAGLQTLAQVNPPLWLMEGMAEYLAIGPNDVHTETVIRDAALHSNLPTIRQMTMRPDQWFPYRFGQSFFRYIGERWGDEAIGQILLSLPHVGIERAFRRELGKSLDEINEEWRRSIEAELLPQVAQLERPRQFSEPLLTNKRSGGEIFLAPALSPDGKHIAFLSNGSMRRGEVFIDLHLADARTGKRIKRLVKSTFNPETEELQLLYSQSSFSPDGRQLAFTALRRGKNVIHILDVDRRRIVRTIDPPVEEITSPSWSPDGQQIVFTGSNGGISDLFLVRVDGRDLRQLTNDRHADMQAVWSPDGTRIAFASDRGPETDFGLLRFSDWRITIFHIADGRIEVLPGQDGHNINPQWAPDSRSIAYVSSRTGIQNLFLYQMTEREHYQLTNVPGGITAVTKYSPAITWATKADRLAYVYFQDGDYTVWAVDDPRSLRREPYRDNAPLVADGSSAQPEANDAAGSGGPAGTGALASNGAPGAAARDSLERATASFYRTPSGFRRSSDAPSAMEVSRSRGTLSVAALLDSASLALPDSGEFRSYPYRVRLSPDYIARPSIGYANDNFGQGVFGGTTVILSDMVGNHYLALAGEVNGRISEARALTAYTNLSRQLQWTAGVYQEPYYFVQGYQFGQDPETGFESERIVLTRYIHRQVFGLTSYPLNRFTRIEAGARYTNLMRSDLLVTRLHDYGSGQAQYRMGDPVANRTVNYVQPYAAFVSDNTLFGFTGPIMGRRMRFQVEPTVGNFRWTEVRADYRRYDPIIFNTITVASRFMSSFSAGRDADSVRKYLGYPELLRGYDRYTFRGANCSLQESEQFYRCMPLLGSRVALANLEVRFPVLRKLTPGPLPIPLPLIEGLVFGDAAVSWFPGQTVEFNADPTEDPSTTRSVLLSHGVGVRVNVYGFAILRWDYAVPHNAPVKKGHWRFSLGPSF